VEAELKRYRIQMEAEVGALTQSNAELKTSYAKTRDQVCVCVGAHIGICSYVYTGICMRCVRMRPSLATPTTSAAH
jgi:hypothetical protein